MNNNPVEKIGYHHLSQELNQVYLEDSFVLEVIEIEDRLEFIVEFVLRGNHPRYCPPKPNEQYCYAIGKLTFPNIKSKQWIVKTLSPSTDSTGSVDYGNIDSFFQVMQPYVIEGVLKTSPIEIVRFWPKEDMEDGDQPVRIQVNKGNYFISGDWGEIVVESALPCIQM